MDTTAVTITPLLTTNRPPDGGKASVTPTNSIFHDEDRQRRGPEETSQASRSDKSSDSTKSDEDETKPAGEEKQAKQAGGKPEFDAADKRIIQKLATRDRAVRAHESAHMAAAAGLSVSAPSYTYKKGPDGRMYAVGGEVSIDTSGVPGDPAATLQKAINIRAAALAPTRPSTQDRAVAGDAASMAGKARAQIAAERTHAARQAQKEAVEGVDEDNEGNKNDAENDLPVPSGNSHAIAAYSSNSLESPASEASATLDAMV